MTMHDHDYYTRREQQERECADRCEEVGTRRIDLELANRYAEIVRDPQIIRPSQF